MITKHLIFIWKWKIFLMYEFELSLLYMLVDFNQSETDLLLLSGCLNGASLINGPGFAHFPLDKWESVKI